MEGLESVSCCSFSPSAPTYVQAAHAPWGALGRHSALSDFSEDWMSPPPGKFLLHRVLHLFAVNNLKILHRSTRMNKAFHGRFALPDLLREEA